MVVPLVAKLGLGLMFGRVKAFLQLIPRWAWIALAVVAVLLAGYWLHGRAVRNAYQTAYAAGRADEKKDWQAAFAKMQEAAAAWRANYEDAATRISTEEGARHDAEIRSNAIRADDLRVHGPGAAACTGPGDRAGLSTAPGGPDAASGTGDASVAGVPEHPSLAAVPWGRLVDYAESCDANRSEVTAWRAWYPRQVQLLKDYKAKLEKQ